MVGREVIEISDGDSDSNDVEVISVSSNVNNNNNNNNNNNVRAPRFQNQQANQRRREPRRAPGHFGNPVNVEQVIDGDDDLQIIGVTNGVRRSESPGVVLHMPDGDVVITGSNEREIPRRSFENAAPPTQQRFLPSPASISRHSTSANIAGQEAYLRFIQNQEPFERNRVREGQFFLNEHLNRLHDERYHFGARTRRRPRRPARQQERNNSGDRRILREFTNGAQAGGRNSRYGGISFDWNDFVNIFGFNDNEYSEGEDPDYFPGMGMPQDDNMGEVMALIERREAEMFDKKASSNLSATNAVQTNFEKQAQLIKSPYTSTIKEDEDYVCTLCGITLGSGFPDDFKPGVTNEPFLKLQEDTDVQAPYQALQLITDADRDLSRRIFIARCGHTYCGRCVKNISGIREVLKSHKKKINRNEKSITNPFVYAPLKCVGPDCKTKLQGSKVFNEVYI